MTIITGTHPMVPTSASENHLEFRGIAFTLPLKVKYKNGVNPFRNG